jgi:hypothetical protein
MFLLVIPPKFAHRAQESFYVRYLELPAAPMMGTHGKSLPVDTKKDSMGELSPLNIVVRLDLTNNPLDVFQRYVLGPACDVANPFKDSFISVHLKNPPGTIAIAGSPHTL